MRRRYYDDDLAHTITQGATTTTLDLDAGGRRTLATTTTTTSSGTSTLARHYADASDNPAWTVATNPQGQVTTTRYGESLGGDLAATLSSDGTASLSLANLHGDVVSTIDIPATSATTDPATGITGWADYTEYGAPRDPAATAAVAGTVGYGWLGAKQRSTTTETAGLTLMGDRLYNPVVGAFTSTDPEPGGNTTAYTYPQDPVNSYDLDGHSWVSKVKDHFRRHWQTYLDVGLTVVALAVPAAGVAVAAYRGYRPARLAYDGYKVLRAVRAYHAGRDALGIMRASEAAGRWAARRWVGKRATTTPLKNGQRMLTGRGRTYRSAVTRASSHKGQYRVSHFGRIGSSTVFHLMHDL